MKSAYELAMERLAKAEGGPSKALTAAQRARLAEIDTLFKGKIAELEAKLRDAQRAAEDATRKSHDASLSVSKDIERIENEKEKVRRSK